MTALRLLHLEDNYSDAELVRLNFAADGLDCEVVHVTNREAFEAALSNAPFDLVITDYAIPGWNGMEALARVRALNSEVPFVFFSGALGEERAVEALKHGATDYVLKTRLPRLVPVVRRALSEAADHRKREQFERALREAEERYRILFEQSPEAIVVLDPQSMLPLDFNDEACRQFGYSRGEFAKFHLKEHLALDQWEAVRTQLEKGLRSGIAEFETNYRNPRGQWRTVWVTLRLIQFQGHPAFHSIWRDITQRQETERRLLRSQRLESIGTLAGGIAHDLNNALAPILMSASLLRESASTEAAALLDLIDTSAQRGAAMVRQLLTFAKGIEGQRVLIQPRHLFLEMEKIIRGTFPKNIRLEVKVEREIGLILGDATQLHQVLLNLCVNARDAMPEGGKLTLEAANAELDESADTVTESVANPGSYVVISVTDSGTGISPELLDRIFDPFFTTKGPEKGTGMGLSTVLGIVRSHQGFIRVHSKLGAGSTFSVHLPLAEGKKTDTEFTRSPTEFQGQGELILVVDDDAAVRHSIEMLLQRLNFRALICGSGHDALVSFAQRRNDVTCVICDLQMPHLDGVGLVQALLRMDPRARVIAMSGNPGEPQVAELKRLGVSAVLMKPFVAAQLVEALRHVLDNITASGKPDPSVET